MRSFADCEAVACASLGAGHYNIHGQLRYCDSDGWMRLWRVGDSTCEQYGWTSNRNATLRGSVVDPVGCRPATPTCTPVPTQPAPFGFRQVRAANWEMWLLNNATGFNFTAPDGRLCDGVTVRDASDNNVFVFAGTGYADARCPCDATAQAATSERLSNASWACGHVNTTTTATQQWKPLSADDQLCTSRNKWTTLASPQTVLKVLLCRDILSQQEDLKLASGDLFVRATVDFNAQHCQQQQTTQQAQTTQQQSTTAMDNSTSMSMSIDRSVEAENSDDMRWIAPTVVAAIAGTLLLIVTVALIITLKRMRSPIDEQWAL